MARVLTTNPPDATGPVANTDLGGWRPVTPDLAGFVDAVAGLVELHGPDEERWFADSCADFDEAQREGDEESATLLLDALVAFSAWLPANDHVGTRP